MRRLLSFIIKPCSRFSHSVSELPPSSAAPSTAALVWVSRWQLFCVRSSSSWLFQAQTDLRALNLFPKYLLMVIAHSIKTSLVRRGQNAAVSTVLWASNQNIPVDLTGSFLFFFLAKCGHNAYGAECSEHTKYKSAVTQERRVGCRTQYMMVTRM